MRRLATTLGAVERGLMAGLMAGVAIVTFLQVIARYVFDHPLEWSEELGRFFLVWMTFVGAGSLVRFADGHPAVDTLEQRSRGTVRLGLRAVSRGMVVLGSIAIAWGGARIAWLQWSQRSPSLEWPMGVIYVSLPIGGLLGVLWGIRTLAGGKPLGDP